MKNISHKDKLKFSVGEKIYYKRGSKIHTTTIKKIVLETDITKKGTTNFVYYIAVAYEKNTWSYSRRDRNFKENQIFNSRDAAKKGMIPTEKSGMLKKIKQLEKIIAQNKASLKISKKKLDEIMKEELIEKLSGIA